jgi:hypothetical protein
MVGFSYLRTFQSYPILEQYTSNNRPRIGWFLYLYKVFLQGSCYLIQTMLTFYWPPISSNIDALRTPRLISHQPLKSRPPHCHCPWLAQHALLTAAFARHRSLITCSVSRAPLGCSQMLTSDFVDFVSRVKRIQETIGCYHRRKLMIASLWLSASSNKRKIFFCLPGY